MFDQKARKFWNNYLNDSNTFIEFSNAMDDVYEKIDDYNPSRKKS